jgi:Skp family chaperone for outer membrane proteins
MSIRKIVLIAGMAVGLANLTGAAFAQKVMVIDEDTIRRTSKVGVAIANQMGAIRNEGIEKLGLKPLSDEIKADEAALKPQVQALTPEAINANPTLKAKVEALGKKQNEFNQKASALNNALDQQQQAAMGMFNVALEPAVEAVAKTAGADVVLSRSATWYYKPAQDLSAKVVARLDATVPTLDALKAAVTPPGAPAAAPATGAGAAAAAPTTPAPTPAPAGLPAPTFPKPGSKPQN